jgi:hypothetical protein
VKNGWEPLLLQLFHLTLPDFGLSVEPVLPLAAIGLLHLQEKKNKQTISFIPISSVFSIFL